MEARFRGTEHLAGAYVDFSADSRDAQILVDIKRLSWPIRGVQMCSK